jgi:hypothetical protein
MSIQSFARWALGSMVIAEGVAAWSRFDARSRLFLEAARRAQSLQRTLVVIGDPDAGPPPACSARTTAGRCVSTRRGVRCAR